MFGKKGFTLIEVVVVTIIIAALALLVMPSFKNSSLTNQMEKAKIGLVELTTAAKLYNEVNSSNPVSGTFNGDMFSSFTAVSDNQGYVYLQNSARWGVRSSDEYSLRDGSGILKCRYIIEDSSSRWLAQTKCKFDKVDQTGTECYLFYIEKDNPAVVKKTRYEENSNDCDDL